MPDEQWIYAPAQTLPDGTTISESWYPANAPPPAVVQTTGTVAEPGVVPLAVAQEAAPPPAIDLSGWVYAPPQTLPDGTVISPTWYPPGNPVPEGIQTTPASEPGAYPSGQEPTLTPEGTWKPEYIAPQQPKPGEPEVGTVDWYKSQGFVYEGGKAVNIDPVTAKLISKLSPEEANVSLEDYNAVISRLNTQIEDLNKAWANLASQYSSQISGEYFTGSEGDFDTFNSEQDRLIAKGQQLDLVSQDLDKRWQHLSSLYAEQPDGSLMLKSDIELVKKQNDAIGAIAKYLPEDAAKVFKSDGSIPVDSIDKIVQSLGRSKASILFDNAGFENPDMLVDDARIRIQLKAQYKDYVLPDGTVLITELTDRIRDDFIRGGSGLKSPEAIESAVADRLEMVSSTLNLQDFTKEQAQDLAKYSVATPEQKFQIMKDRKEFKDNDYFIGVDEKTRSIQYVTLSDNAKANAQLVASYLHKLPTAEYLLNVAKAYDMAPSNADKILANIKAAEAPFGFQAHSKGVGALKAWWTGLPDDKKAIFADSWKPMTAGELAKGVFYGMPIVSTVRSAQERGLTSGWTIAGIIGDTLIFAPIVKGALGSIARSVSPSLKLSSELSIAIKAETAAYKGTIAMLEKNFGTAVKNKYMDVLAKWSDSLKATAKADIAINSTKLSPAKVSSAVTAARRADAALESAATEYINAMKATGKLKFDVGGTITSFPTTAKMLEELPKDLVRSVKDTYSYIKNPTGVAQIKKLEAAVTKAKVALEAAQSKHPADATMWTDLLQEYSNTEYKLLQAKTGSLARMQEQLATVRSEITRLKAGKITASDVSEVMSNKISTSVSKVTAATSKGISDISDVTQSMIKARVQSMTKGLSSAVKSAIDTLPPEARTIATSNYRITARALNTAKTEVNSAISLANSELKGALGKVSAKTYSETLARIDKLQTRATSALRLTQSGVRSALRNISVYSGANLLRIEYSKIISELAAIEKQILHTFRIIKKELEFAFKMTKISIGRYAKQSVKGLTTAGKNITREYDIALSKLKTSINSSLKTMSSSATFKAYKSSLNRTSRSINKALQPVSKSIEGAKAPIAKSRLSLLTSEEKSLVKNLRTGINRMETEVKVKPILDKYGNVVGYELEPEISRGGTKTKPRTAPKVSGGGTSTLPKVKAYTATEATMAIGTAIIRLPIAKTQGETTKPQTVAIPSIITKTYTKEIHTGSTELDRAVWISVQEALANLTKQNLKLQNISDGKLQDMIQESVQQSLKNQLINATKLDTELAKQLQQKLKLKLALRLAVKLATKIATKTKLKMTIIPPPSDEPKSKTKTLRHIYPDGTATWRMGKLHKKIWHVLEPPYRQQNYSIVVSDTPPKGATETTATKVAETIQEMGGRLGKDITIDIGAFDMHLMRAKPKPITRFTRDIHGKTKHELTAKGARVVSGMR